MPLRRPAAAKATLYLAVAGTSDSGGAAVEVPQAEKGKSKGGKGGGGDKGGGSQVLGSSVSLTQAPTSGGQLGEEKGKSKGGNGGGGDEGRGSQARGSSGSLTLAPVSGGQGGTSELGDGRLAASTVSISTFEKLVEWATRADT